jgi:hypothetical protein
MWGTTTMDPAVTDTRAEEGSDPASDFIASMISSLPGSGAIGKSREAQRQWYESLSQEQQMQVRDRIRAEISRIRSQFGKRTDSIAAPAVRFRDYG